MTRGVRPILILAAAVRVALLLAAWGEPGRLLTPDSHEYAALARSLGNGEGFTADGQPEIFRTPGYPMLLLIGTVFQAARLQAVAVVQVLADVLLVYLTYLLAMLTVADRRAALAAAGWQAVCVVAVVSSVRILSDGTYACLLTLALCLVAAHLRTGRWWALLSGAGVTAAACYVRPVGLSMAVVMAAVLLTRRRRWRRTAAFAGVVAALLSPWVVRNWTEARYAGFSSFATDSMYYFAVPALRAERALQDPAAARDLQRRRGARHAATQPTPGDAAEWRAR
ncbi:MAG: glycosyltransferase family 39 protein, partial [Planctomycetota bacterium]